MYHTLNQLNRIIIIMLASLGLKNSNMVHILTINLRSHKFITVILLSERTQARLSVLIPANLYSTMTPLCMACNPALLSHIQVQILRCTRCLCSHDLIYTRNLSCNKRCCRKPILRPTNNSLRYRFRNMSRNLTMGTRAPSMTRIIWTHNKLGCGSSSQINNHAQNFINTSRIGSVSLTRNRRTKAISRNLTTLSNSHAFTRGTTVWYRRRRHHLQSHCAILTLRRIWRIRMPMQPRFHQAGNHQLTSL